MTVRRLVLVIFFALSASLSAVATSRLGKCCPAGEIFSGASRVDCVPASRHSIELYTVDYGTAVRYDGFPMCNEPEDISTTPLSEFKSDDFLQVPACLEILHESTSKESLPIVVHCRSNKDRDEKEKSPSASLPALLDLRRCCPQNKVFDRRIRSCVPAIESGSRENRTEIDEFMSLMPRELKGVDFLRISRGLPSCEHALFDYEVAAENLLLEDGKLQMTLPFHDDDAVDTNISISGSNACLELTTESRTNRKLVVRACRGFEHCQKNVCVRKCCQEDEFFFFTGGCNKLDESGSTVDFYKALSNATNRQDSDAIDYGLLLGTPCKYDMYPLIPEDKWSITPEGYIHLPDFETYQHHQYCMDILYNNSQYEETLYPLVCFDDPEKSREATEARFMVNTILEVTSCTFLLLTLLVYACLPVLQNLHGKTLMCHVASLLLAFVCLATIPWITPGTFYWENQEDVTRSSCTTLGYTMLFAFLSAFCWLNVMCFDIWWTFGGLRGGSTRGRAHRKRFLLYNLYAWGLSMLLTILVIAVDHTEILPGYLMPNIGLTSCWFPQLPGHYGELLFFVGPIAIQLVSNIVFFVITSVHCNKVKSEIKRVIGDPSDPRSKRFHADRTKLVMNVKLFIVMGLSWVMEIASFFMNKYAPSVQHQEELFYISDAYNCLQGLAIFILFVLKQRVYVALRKRLGFKTQKKNTGSQATTALQDPYRVKKSASSSTLMSTFAVSMAP